MSTSPSLTSAAPSTDEVRRIVFETLAAGNPVFIAYQNPNFEPTAKISICAAIDEKGTYSPGVSLLPVKEVDAVLGPQVSVKYGNVVIAPDKQGNITYYGKLRVDAGMMMTVGLRGTQPLEVLQTATAGESTIGDFIHKIFSTINLLMLSMQSGT
jgi:hypothetical protein